MSNDTSVRVTPSVTPLPAILALTTLASVGTGVIWNGIPFIAKHDYGFGQTLARQMVDFGTDRARRHGVSVTGLKNAGHVGRVGAWAERAAAANCASVHMVNVRGSLLVAPFGGVDRRGSTSPFAAGIPMPEGEDPIILDFATSLVAEGKALVALRGGKALPEGSLVAADGALSSDPSQLYGELEADRYPSPYNGPGALTGFGLHKGSGLNFFMEMFAGAMTGCGTAGANGEPTRRRFSNGMFSIFMALEYFHSNEWFATEVRNYVEFVKSSRPVQPGGEVLIPGEKELRTKAERERSGLPLAPQVWEDLKAAARKAGLGENRIAELTGAGAL